MWQSELLKSTKIKSIGVNWILNLCEQCEDWVCWDLLHQGLAFRMFLEALVACDMQSVGLQGLYKSRFINWNSFNDQCIWWNWAKTIFAVRHVRPHHAYLCMCWLLFYANPEHCIINFNPCILVLVDGSIILSPIWL